MLYLASQSPRRRQLLEQMGVDFRLLKVVIPECPAMGETAYDYVSRVARDKALAGFKQCPGKSVAWVLGADTEVLLDNQVLGKPANAAAARRMLQLLGGRSHTVLSVVWLIGADGVQCAHCFSQVRFASLDEERIATYVSSGEPFGKAGAYAIQGRGAALIAHLEGSYSGVMGLPLFETMGLLRARGLA